MKREMHALFDIVERYAVGNQRFERKLAAEDQAGGFGLQVDIRAIGTESDALADANIGAAEVDAFRGGGLCEQ
jgi:hypothetical protein